MKINVRYSCDQLKSKIYEKRKILILQFGIFFLLHLFSTFEEKKSNRKVSDRKLMLMFTQKTRKKIKYSKKREFFSGNCSNKHITQKATESLCMLAICFIKKHSIKDFYFFYYFAFSKPHGENVPFKNQQNQHEILLKCLYQ